MIYNLSAHRDVPGYKSSGPRCFVGQFAQGFPSGSDNKESDCNARDTGSIPELGRSPGEGKGYALQYSGLENSMDCIVHGVSKSQTQLSDFHFTALKKKLLDHMKVQSIL